MAWNPAIPATNADLLSAPVRDNFGALDTALMAALATLANGAVLTKAAGPVIAGVPAGTNGHVLTLASGAPVWQAAPTGGGAVGAWDWSTTTTSPATSNQMRLNVAHPYTTATTLWVRYVTTGGTDARIALLLTKPDQTLHIQDKNDSNLYVRLRVTAAPTDDAANGQVVLPVAWISNGNALLNNQNVLMVIGAAPSASFTPGSVLFAGASGAIAQDNANLFFDDTNNNLRLFGGLVGTSGARVLALGDGTVPNPVVDTVQIVAHDYDDEAGSKVFYMRDERGAHFRMGSLANGISRISIVSPSFTEAKMEAKEDGTAFFGATANITVRFGQNNSERITLASDANIYLILPGLTGRTIAYGAPDSGGAGYRMLRIGN
jgi:hypothetical protein